MLPLKILVIGSGGREHALTWKLGQEAEVHAAPGNPGMQCERHPLDISDFDACLALSKSLKPDFVLVGPENPLVGGLADRLRSDGFAVFGPNQAGAQLEASKAFSKAVMAGSGAPTADYVVCSDPKEASNAVKSFFDRGHQVAVKASGAALGKGVVVCDTIEQANEAIQWMMIERAFGVSGDTLVIEERLVGREFSLLTICSENGYWSLPVAQDYKRIFDGDRGPMTGGMGSYSPVEWVAAHLIEQCEHEVVAPALKNLSSQNIQYRGVLFSGFMLTETGPKCLEYNVRFGDPETQSIVRRLGNGFAETLHSTSIGESPRPCEVRSDVAAVTVVLANRGYPGAVASKPTISLPSALGQGTEVFHAGTSIAKGSLVASGGRVLNVSATGNSIDAARRRAYKAIDDISFDGMQFRTDIAAN